MKKWWKKSDEKISSWLRLLAAGRIISSGVDWIASLVVLSTIQKHICSYQSVPSTTRTRSGRWGSEGLMQRWRKGGPNGQDSLCSVCLNLDKWMWLWVAERLAQRLTCGLEDARVALAVTGSKRLHHAVDLLGLAGQTETPQELPAIRGETGSGSRVRVTLGAHVPVCVCVCWRGALLTGALARGSSQQTHAGPQRPAAPWCWSRP